MEKEKIQILRIAGNDIQRKEDEVALEYRYNIELKNNRKIRINDKRKGGVS